MKLELASSRFSSVSLLTITPQKTPSINIYNGFTYFWAIIYSYFSYRLSILYSFVIDNHISFDDKI